MGQTFEMRSLNPAGAIDQKVNHSLKFANLTVMAGSLSSPYWMAIAVVAQRMLALGEQATAAAVRTLAIAVGGKPNCAVIFQTAVHLVTAFVFMLRCSLDCLLSFARFSRRLCPWVPPY